MRRLAAPAILLDVVDLAERDRIVTFLTAEHGKRRGVARGARAKYSRFAGQLQPLAKVDVGWFEKEGRDLVRISEVALLRAAAPLQRDLEGILLGAYLAEHMTVFAQENEDSHRLFRLLDATLEALLAGVDRDLAARYYEVWVLRLSGIFPVPRGCPLCGRPLGDRAVLLASEAAVACPDCARAAAGGGIEIGAAELDVLRRTGSEPVERLAERPPPRAALRRVEALAARVRREFLGHELKSHGVMQRTLAALDAAGGAMGSPG